ncbi:hypothetical protein K470DRAFT_261006 [Piedraia hortae CBS 480.64]|uniref:Clr5 domain-containing protein n=1 Tax=Piedraia hortae CBS 480.64 TaxID=1314780 RepID=A0A6A7BPP2_9PEZI|nr:hypothetical protein K470DRAFT_261006 [Piedraia hortae CBS 480.64]
MPAPRLDLDEWRDRVAHLITNEDFTVKEVIRMLRKTHDLKVSDCTLRRRLKEWGIRKSNPPLKAQDPSQQNISAEIRAMHTNTRLTDAEMAEMLSENGYKVSARVVAKIRKEMGLYKRTMPYEEDEVDQNIEEVLERELKDKKVTGLNRNELYDYIRRQYPHLRIVGRNRVARIARRINPQAVQDRVRNSRFKVGNTVALDSIQKNRKRENVDDFSPQSEKSSAQPDDIRKEKSPAPRYSFRDRERQCKRVRTRR